MLSVDSMPHRVLLLASGIDSTGTGGGIEAYNRVLVRALKSHGAVVVTVDQRRISRSVPLPRHVPRLITYALRGLQLALFAVVATLRHRPDLYICAHARYLGLMHICRLLRPKPLILQTHGVEVWSMSTLQRVLARRASAVATVSRFSRDRIQEQLRCDPMSISVIHNTTDFSRFQPQPKPAYLLSRHGLDRSAFVLLTVCRLSESERNKGYMRVIESVSEIRHQYPFVRYILAGTGDDVSHIRREIAKRHLEPLILLPGYVPDSELPDYYNLADLFIMPSQKEGFGIVFIEAQASGVPVVGGNRDGSVDALQDGELGTLVDPTDQAAVTRAITAEIRERTRLDENRRGELRSRAQRLFSEETFRAQVGLLVRSVIGAD